MQIRSKLPFIVTLGVLLLLGSSSFWMDRLPVRFFKNYSTSEKPGLYVVSKATSVGKGDLVLISFPDAAKMIAKQRPWLHDDIPLLKRVVGLPNDRICHEDGKLIVNGSEVVSILSKDSHGNEIESVSGCYQIERGEFLPINVYSPYSFDGRYFGPISSDLIIGKATSLWTF